MKIKKYRDHFINELIPIYDAMEAESFFALVLEHLHAMKRIDLALYPDMELSTDDLQKWNGILDKLKQQIPVQYILGSTFFYGLKFEVNHNVLIPRPETEELVQWIIESQQDLKPLNIVDIGTGSGCIAISLAKTISGCNVTAVDVSSEALKIAERNAKSNEVAVKFEKIDILTCESMPDTYDIIVSNPPYVRMLEKNEMRRNVLENEPHLALFVDDHDALIFYRKIASLARESLKKDGWLYFEINQYLAGELEYLLKDLGFKNITIKQDIYGNDRMARCQNR